MNIERYKGYDIDLHRIKHIGVVTDRNTIKAAYNNFYMYTSFENVTPSVNVNYTQKGLPYKDIRVKSSKSGQSAISKIRKTIRLEGQMIPRFLPDSAPSYSDMTVPQDIIEDFIRYKCGAGEHTVTNSLIEIW